ncbi:helix-turn-helix domain-containing protein [Desulfobotulus mexicanus]|uniref:AraC family transcriptional regulator n=1 Tax=Desulfobotulus mexicanus TaxID=2586642 RepID=A0A5S5ME46_9BACT|nr:helix-turn-helix domain-containing protein [Desulfobotulus mexicanus]TYT73993.1 AraC family transcriptional regulator [Desulfobotulus mexicanus]
MGDIICSWKVCLPGGKSLVWPDGCRDLIAILPKNQAPELICSGLDTSPRIVICPEETRFVGIRLAPGLTFPWEKDDPGSKCRDLSISPYPPSWQRFCFEADHDEIQNALLEVVSLASPAPHWITDYLTELGTEGIKRATAFSQRSIRRHLVRFTGASSNYWKGLARVRKAGSAIATSDIALADIAADHGFSDQAHLNREIRRWFGCTPKMLRMNRELSTARLTAPDAFPNPQSRIYC